MPRLIWDWPGLWVGRPGHRFETILTDGGKPYHKGG